MSHLSPEQLSGYIDGALADADREAVESHFATCNECLRELAEIARVNKQFQSALTHDPGEAYFDSFADRVLERVTHEAVLVKPASEAPKPYRRKSFLDRLSDWFAGPRLAWAGTAAAVIIGAGVVFMISRESTVRSPIVAEIEGRSDQVERRSGMDAPQAKQEGMQVLEEQKSDRAPAEVGTMATKAGETKENDRLAAGARADDPQLSAGDEVASIQSEPPGPSFAAPPPAAGGTSTAPRADDKDKKLAAAEGAAAKTSLEKSRAREVQRLEGENVPAPESQSRTQQAAPAPSANFTQPSTDAASRVKAQQSRQVAEPLQSSSATRVCGTVRDDRGRPLSGAQVVIADLGVTARSDASGRFCVDAPAGKHTVAAMAVGFGEARRTVEVGDRTANVEFALIPVSVLADAKRESWPEEARDLAADAEAGTVRALASNSAASWDSVALQWSKTAAAVPSGEALVRARGALAEARYRAWKLAPSPGRTGVAAAALQSYIEVAPQGADKRRAQQRLAEVEQR
jgi:Carboxypeptidase regulatory-like domain/Putative zinc-finger